MLASSVFRVLMLVEVLTVVAHCVRPRVNHAVGILVSGVGHVVKRTAHSGCARNIMRRASQANVATTGPAPATLCAMGMLTYFVLRESTNSRARGNAGR